jgi:hypothetical protein
MGVFLIYRPEAPNVECANLMRAPAAVLLALAPLLLTARAEAQPQPPPDPAPAPAPDPAPAPAPAPDPNAPTLGASTGGQVGAPADARAGVPATTPANPDEQAHERSIDRQRSRAMIQEDLLPSVQVIKTDQVEIRAGGLMQLYVAPYAGDDSLISNNDPVTRPGFRLRRASIGLEGRLGDKLGVLVAVNPTSVDAEGSVVGDAKVFFALDPAARFSAGTSKIAFSRGTLETARSLTGLERPLSSTTITPARRLGITVEGEVAKGHFAYLLSATNGTEGFIQGNQYGGFLGAGRLELRLADLPDPWKAQDGVIVAINGFGQSAPATTSVGYGADIFAAVSRFHAKIEGICDRTKPKDSPAVPSTLPDTLERCGAYAEVGYVVNVPEIPFQPTVRAELFDDNSAIADAGDVALIDAGINAPLYRQFLRAQLRWVSRIERKGESRSNDAAVISLQGAF